LLSAHSEPEDTIEFERLLAIACTRLRQSGLNGRTDLLRCMRNGACCPPSQAVRWP
jgi:hypothetical protein